MMYLSDFFVMQDLTEEVVGILETAGSSIQCQMLMCVQKSKIWIKFERRGRRKPAKFRIWRASHQRVKNLAERGAIRATRGEIKEEGLSKLRNSSDRKTWILFIIVFYLPTNFVCSNSKVIYHCVLLYIMDLAPWVLVHFDPWLIFVYCYSLVWWLLRECFSIFTKW